MTQREELMRLQALYFALLGVPQTSQWRVHNQAVYASVRDEIAYLMGRDPQFVQDLFEGILTEHPINAA